MRGCGALGFGRSMKGEREEAVKKKRKNSSFPCCTSRGRRKRNSVA